MVPYASHEEAEMPGATVKGLMECPTCGTDDFEAVTDGVSVNLLCTVCHTCWHVELGWMHRVDPRTCLGCSHHEECLAVQAAVT